jgi:benzodiazapine receptor
VPPSRGEVTAWRTISSCKCDASIVEQRGPQRDRPFAVAGRPRGVQAAAVPVSDPDRPQHRRELRTAVAATAAAAVAGNGLVGRDALAWFRSLRRPRGMPSMPVFMVVGGVYYVLIGTVLYRSLERHDRRATRLAQTVLVLNEAWNVAFFGRRSTRNGFIGTVAFCVPLSALQVAVRHDPPSRRLVAAYGCWVAYDLWWSHRLWRLNP